MSEQKFPTLPQLIESKLPEKDKESGYNVLMNITPPQSWVKVNKFANNSKYIPIDKVEFLLTKVFGRFRVEILRTQLIGNSVEATVRLHYFHPVYNEWDWMDGIGAHAIQCDAGASPSDWSKIKTDGVKKASPIAVAEAEKNAAKKLGRLFGRDLNRDNLINYETLIDKDKFNNATLTEK